MHLISKVNQLTKLRRMTSRMHLIVGLGNPGKEYVLTRHNSGFTVIDRLVDDLDIKLDTRKFKGVYGRYKDTIILKPETYMNLSGECVRNIVNYFKIKIEDIIVVYDDMDLPVGKIRIRETGSSAGQKGMQNIIDLLHTKDIKRIRVGIGSHDLIETKDYVLGKISKDEKEVYDEAVKRAADALAYSIDHDFKEVMNKFNGQ